MVIIKHKKLKDSIIICIILITLFEVYFAYKVLKDCKGIYQVGIFIPFIIQPFSYIRLFKKEVTYYKFRFIILGLVSLFLPLLIYFTLPNYTYNEGKQIVGQYVQSSGNPVFIDILYNRDTVPLADSLNRLFVSNRAYYYGIKLTANNVYFIVNPLTGKVKQLSEDYWGFENNK